jgi:uncharacterized membrane protein
MIRHDGIDRARGLAVLLMIGDHFAAVADVAVWYRLTVSRLALPIFLVIAGYLACGRTPRRRRLGQILAAGIAAGVVCSQLPALSPIDILVWIAAVFACWGLVHRYPATVAALGAVQAYTFVGVIPGYQPGLVACLMAVGVLLARGGPTEPAVLLRATERLPAVLAVVGRYPLAWYLGHLVGLWLLVLTASTVPRHNAQQQTSGFPPILDADGQSVGRLNRRSLQSIETQINSAELVKSSTCQQNPYKERTA